MRTLQFTIFISHPLYTLLALVPDATNHVKAPEGFASHYRIGEATALRTLILKTKVHIRSIPNIVLKNASSSVTK